MNNYISLATSAFLDYYNATMTATGAPMTAYAADSIRTAEAVWLDAAASAATEIAAASACAADDPGEARAVAEAAARQLTADAPAAVQATIIKLAGDAASAAVVASPAYQNARDQELAGGWTLEGAVRPTARHLHGAAERKWGAVFLAAKAERERHEHIFLDDALDRPSVCDDRWGRD